MTTGDVDEPRGRSPGGRAGRRRAGPRGPGRRGARPGRRDAAARDAGGAGRAGSALGRRLSAELRLGRAHRGPAITASATLPAKSRMARSASSLPGMSTSTSSGSQLVSTTPITGIPSLRASATAIASLRVSITKTASGTLFMPLMPERFFSSLPRSLSRWASSFLVSRSRCGPAAGSIISSSFRRSRLLRMVTKFVSRPPSQRSLTKGMPQRCASSAMASWAWRFVPTNRMFLPWRRGPARTAARPGAAGGSSGGR